MEWELGMVLLMGMCVLVATAPVAHPVAHVRPYATTSFPNGSVVLLSPRGEVRTTLEKLFTGTPITHVGLVCVDAGGTPFLFHTLRATGARLEPLVPWIRATTREHQVFVRRLVHPPAGPALEIAIAPLLGVQYSFGFWKAVMGAWWPGVEMPRATAPTDRFCSELVAEVLEKVGVLHFAHTPLSARLVLPGDFWATTRLPFGPGAGLLGPEELL